MNDFIKLNYVGNDGKLCVRKIGDPLPMVVKWDGAGFRTFGKYDGQNYVGYVGHTDI